ncbi:IS1 family transposase [Pseudomonadota bacterium]
MHRASRKIIAFEIGSRGAKPFKKLLAQLNKYDVRLFTADSWRVYRKLIPENKLVQSKKQTYTVESMNNKVRHYLARFRRRTCCYSKSVLMVEMSLLFFLQNDLLSSILI